MRTPNFIAAEIAAKVDSHNGRFLIEPLNWVKFQFVVWDLVVAELRKKGYNATPANGGTSSFWEVTKSE